jgi:hypothetical protein
MRARYPDLADIAADLQGRDRLHGDRPVLGAEDVSTLLALDEASTLLDILTYAYILTSRPIRVSRAQCAEGQGRDSHLPVSLSARGDPCGVADALAVATLRSRSVAKAALAQRQVGFSKWSTFAVTHGLQGDTAEKYLLTHKARRLPNPVDIPRLSGDWLLQQAMQAGLKMLPAGGNKRVGFDSAHVVCLL